MSFLEQLKLWSMFLIVIVFFVFVISLTQVLKVYVKLSPEVSVSQYEIVAGWKEYFEYVPEVVEMIDEATKDNKILELEYNAIKEEIDKVRLKKYKKELGMEYEVSN